MKRSYFIAIATTLALVLIAVWVYVLFFSTPNEPGDSFAELNFGDTTDGSVPANPLEPEPVVDVVNTETLRQLTTKPVVGFTEVVNNQGSLAGVFYIEAGTGHIFSIDLNNGTERRVSGTTFAQIKRGDITPNAQYVMIETGSGSTREFVLGEFSSSTNEYVFNTVTEQITNFIATKENNFLFTTLTGNTLVASQYYPLSKTADVIFEVPFIDTVVRWGESALDNHYIYPKASARLEGYLYQSIDNKLGRISASGRGLTAIGNQEHVLYSTQVDRNYRTSLYNLETKEDIDLTGVFNAIIDKCVNYPVKQTFICGTDNSPKNQNTPDDWYRGQETYSDSLWEVDPTNLSFRQLVNITSESGRAVDTLNLEMGPTEENVYFQNKSDMTLWMFTLPEIPKPVELDTSTSSDGVVNDDLN